MPSVKDIANATNVSSTTVSMVLNNKPGISDSTRELVLNAAKNLGYRLKTKADAASSSIALVFLTATSDSSEYDTPIFSQMIAGVSIRAQSLNYRLLVSTYHKNDVNAAASITKSGCIGVILMISEADGNTNFSVLDSLNLPIVILDKSIIDRPYDTVSANHYQSAYMATEHLISLGHRKLYFFRGDLPNATAYRERYLGYQQAVMSHEETFICANNTLSFSRNPEELAVLIKALPVLPTGIVCAGDWYAYECIQALKILGYSVPEDISVIGFDNTPLCESTTPKLTAMDMPKLRMGALAVDRLLDVINGKTEGESVRIEVFCNLVLRESTAKPKQR